MRPEAEGTRLHLSQDDIELLVSERPTAREYNEIETHVSNCPHCQERVLNAAADREWRSEMSSSLLQVAAGVRGNAATWGLDTDVTKRQSDGDDFELQSVRLALAKLLEPANHPEMMGRLGRYDIESIIGFGGMGVVLRGFDQELHRPVAIKMILPRWARNGTAKQRFAREARAAAAVLHPNVIAIHGIDETRKVPWFVMPLVAGPSLQRLVEENGPVQEADIVRIGLQIAAGLAAAHGQGLVHRDIKPGNILLDNQVNRVVITDFGLARCETDESMTKTGWLAGTLNYMSPEQSRGEDCDTRSDLFSLGSLLYFLATGHLPFRADSPMGVLHKISNERPRPVHLFNAQISPALVNVINRLLEKKPEDRFQSAAEVESLLGHYVSHLNQPFRVALPRTSYTSKTARRRRWQIACGLAAGLVIAAILFRFLIPVTVSERGPTSAKTWHEIAIRYGLEDVSRYHEQLSALANEVREMNLELERLGTWPESDSLNSQISELEQLLQFDSFGAR